MDTTAPTATFLVRVVKQPQFDPVVDIKSEPEDFEDYKFEELGENNVECKIEKKLEEREGSAKQQDAEGELYEEGVAEETEYEEFVQDNVDIKTEKEPGEGEDYAQEEDEEEELHEEGVPDEQTKDDQSNDFDNEAVQQNINNCNVGQQRTIRSEPDVPLANTRRTLRPGKPLLCSLCKSFFEDSQALLEHKLLEHYNIFKCSICSVRVNGLDNLNKHCDTAHKGQQCFKCDLCSATFACRPSYEYHQESHALCFKCQHCQYFCSTRKLLSRHVHIAHQSEQNSKDYKPFNCELCGASFKYDFTYEAHLKAHKSEVVIDSATKVMYIKPRSESINITSKTVDNEKVENKPEDFNTKVYKCSKCPSSHKTKREHEIHMKIHQTPKQSDRLQSDLQERACRRNENQTKRKLMKVTLTLKDKQTIQCTFCQKYFLSPSMLFEHEVTQHRALQCGFCHKFFVGYNNLTSHFKAEHCKKTDVAKDNHKEFETQVETDSSASTSFETGQHGETRLMCLCGMCITFFDGLESLAKHFETAHGGQRLYGCSRCTATFACMTDWEKHHRSHIHKFQDRSDSLRSEPSLKCRYCGYSFNSQHFLSKHIFLKHKSEVKTSKESEVSNGDVEVDGSRTAGKGDGEHQEFRTEPVVSSPKVYNRKRLQCSLCKDMFEHPRVLFEHRQTEHNSFKCRHCQKTINGLANLKRHTESEHGQEPRYSCSRCPATFASKVNFETHLRAHTQIKAKQSGFLCSYCRCNFATYNLLSMHLLRVHLEKKRPALADEASTGNINTSVEAKVDNEKKHPGIKIGQVFSLSEKEHHDIKQKGVYCSVCYKCFENLSALVEHKRAEHNPVVCVSCRKQVNGLDHLADHFRLDHGRELRYCCSKCTATFASRPECKIHQKSHQQDKLQVGDFKCKHCECVYLTAQLLSRHMQMVHLDQSNQDSEDNLTCKVCGEGFESTVAYETHLREELKASLSSSTEPGNKDDALADTSIGTKRIKLESDTD